MLQYLNALLFQATLLQWARQRSRYSDWLWTGRPGDRITKGAHIQGGREVTVHPDNTHLRLNISLLSKTALLPLMHTTWLCPQLTELTPAGIEPVTFRFVARHLNHCATAVPQRDKEERNILHTIKRWKGNWTGQILFLKQQLLDDQQEKRGYWKLKGEASTRWHSAENSRCKSLWTCHQTDCRMKMM